MFKIIKKENLAPNIFLMDVEAPRIAKYALPGQFLIVRVDEEGERIPLTICDYDSASWKAFRSYGTAHRGTQEDEDLLHRGRRRNSACLLPAQMA